MTIANSPHYKFLLLGILLLYLFPATAQEKPPYINPFSGDSSYIFSSDISYKEFSTQGYLGLKYTDACNFRISVNSALGSTLLDLEWKNGEFIEHFILEDLNNPFIINKLQKDFELIFLNVLQRGKSKNDRTRKVKCHTYKLAINDNSAITTIEDRNWLGRLKRSVTFHYSNANDLRAVRLKHYNLALQLVLTSID